MKSSSRTACSRTFYCFTIQPASYSKTQYKEEMKSRFLLNLVMSVSVSVCMREREREREGTSNGHEAEETGLALNSPATKASNTRSQVSSFFLWRKCSRERLENKKRARLFSPSLVDPQRQNFKNTPKQSLLSFRNSTDRGRETTGQHPPAQKSPLISRIWATTTTTNVSCNWGRLLR